MKSNKRSFKEQGDDDPNRWYKFYEMKIEKLDQDSDEWLHGVLNKINWYYWENESAENCTRESFPASSENTFLD